MVAVMDLNAAIAPGLAGAASYDTALSQAVTFWQNEAANAYDTMEAMALDDTTSQAAAAIVLLQAEQTRIHNPSAGVLPY